MKVKKYTHEPSVKEFLLRVLYKKNSKKNKNFLVLITNKTNITQSPLDKLLILLFKYFFATTRIEYTHT